jgi:N-alpha-acetyltransferase 50
MNQVLENAKKYPDLKEIYLHVHTVNTDAVRFYQRFGFEVTEKVERYYQGINPPDCFVLRKPLHPEWEEYVVCRNDPPEAAWRVE